MKIESYPPRSFGGRDKFYAENLHPGTSGQKSERDAG